MNDELEKLLAEATSGPWFTFANGHCVGGTPTDGSAGGIAMCSMAARTPEEVQANAALICAAVNALPELLAIRDAARTALGCLDDPTGGDHVNDMRRASDVLRAALNQETKHD